MKSTRLSWFKFYPADFVTSPDVVMMSPAARGFYISILAHCWMNVGNGGGIPAKNEYILAICNASSKEWDESKDTVLAKFEKKDGQLFNKRLIVEMKEALELSESKSDNAQSGWEKRRIADAVHPHSIREASAPIRVEQSRTETDKNRQEQNSMQVDFFKTISVRYRSAFGVGSTKAKQIREAYIEAISQFGEEKVLACFDEWEKANQYRKERLGNFGLKYFLADLPSMIEEVTEVAALESRRDGPTIAPEVLDAANERARIAGRAEVAKQIAQIQAEKDIATKLNEGDDFVL